MSIKVNARLVSGMKGIFTLAPPYADMVLQDVEYTLSAISTIGALEQHALNVESLVFIDPGLTSDDYRQAVEGGIGIATLTSAGQPTIYVPETYISTTPNQNVVPYYEPIVSMSLGLLPQSLDLTLLQQQLAAVISDVIGVQLENDQIILGAMPLAKAVSADEHATLETKRLALITLRTSDRAKYLEMLEKYDEVVRINHELSKIIVDSGLAIPT
jgi:hypothetical protein